MGINDSELGERPSMLFMTLTLNLAFAMGDLVGSSHSHADLGEGRGEEQQHGLRGGHRQLGPRGVRLHRRLHHRALGRHHGREGRQAEA